MLLISRDIFVCKCATDVPRVDVHVGQERWLRGTEEHLALLRPNEHRPSEVEELRARLGRGEHWVLGLENDLVVSYTWLHTRSTIDFPYLPGCTFRVAPGVGYGYDAWTLPERRGTGLRRRGFVEELRVLQGMGMTWETSFFAQHQIDGAKRSLATVGIEVVPLWRARLAQDRTLTFERLAVGDETTMPLELPARLQFDETKVT